MENIERNLDSRIVEEEDDEGINRETLPPALHNVSLSSLTTDTD